MEIMGSEGELSSGYKLVPWSSWDQWDFVRDSILSSSPDSVSRALQRISAWRSRGCLPVPIDVTAAIVEIQQKDPYFRAGSPSDILNSEELLAMLYCMAIMRLVNCFVEPAHKKTGRSISELADAVGIPRMLVDIRHESSHRNLPSLRLVRMASVKALDWLKSNYWEPQKSAIPDVQKQVRSRLREMSIYLKIKHARRSSSSPGNGKRCKRSGVLMRCNKLSSQIAGKLRASKSDGTISTLTISTYRGKRIILEYLKDSWLHSRHDLEKLINCIIAQSLKLYLWETVSDKRISKITKIIARLYSSYPSEVVEVLLEFCHLQGPDFSDGIDLERSHDSHVDDPGPHIEAMCDLKTIITKLSSKKPGLILSILKSVLEMIEVKESAQSEKGGCNYFSSRYRREMAETSRLCSLVHWLLMSLKSLKDSGRIGVTGESPELSTDTDATPNVSLTKLLQKILFLSVSGDKHLTSSALLLARMIGNNSLTARLKKIPLLVTQNQHFIDESTYNNTENMLIQEEAFIKKATEKLEFLKSHLRNRSSRNSNSGRTDATNRRWTVAKSWTPCPIGMLPCSFSSTAVLPVLDKVNDTVKTDKVETNNDEDETPTNTDYFMNEHLCEKREADGNFDENESATKLLKMSRDEQELDIPETLFPMEGRLLIGGVWKKVSEEELLDIESNIRIFSELLPMQS